MDTMTAVFEAINKNDATLVSRVMRNETTGRLHVVSRDNEADQTYDCRIYPAGRVEDAIAYAKFMQAK